MQTQRVEWASLYSKLHALILLLFAIAFFGGCGSDEEDLASIADGGASQLQDVTAPFCQRA